MNPSTEAITKIRAQVTDWAPDNATLRAALNAATVPNPNPQGTVLATIYSAEVMGRLSPESLAKVKLNTALPQIREDIKAQRRAECVEWVFFSLGCGDITSGEAASINAYLHSTMPDPSWQPLLPWSTLPSNIGRMLDDDDIQAAREAD